MDEYININKIAELKGLKSTRSIRLAINQGKYIAREVEVRGGKSYEILYSSLEPDIQDRLDEEKLKTTSIVPFENKVNFVSENARLTALARVDIVTALYNLRKKYPTKKEADSVFLDLYNSGMYLPQIYKFVGSISIGTLHRWVKTFENYGTDGLLQKRKTNKQGEYNTILNEEMKQIFLKYLLHPNKFSIGKAINLTKHILEKRGYENIPCNLTFRRFAENFKKNNYSKWILFREGEKANISCATLANEQQTNASGIQNLLKNVGAAIGTSIATTMISRFSQVHQMMMIKNLTETNDVYMQKLNSFISTFAQYTDLSTATYMAKTQIYQLLREQATLWGYIETFRYYALASLIVIPFIYLLHEDRKKKDIQ